MKKLQLNDKMFGLYGALPIISKEIRNFGLVENDNKRYNYRLFECAENTIDYKIDDNEYVFNFYIKVPYKQINNMRGNIEYAVFLVKAVLLQDRIYCCDLNIEKCFVIVNLDLELVDDLTSAILLTNN